MYYVDSQRTLTRRDSSLITSKKYQGLDDAEALSSARAQSSARLTSDSGTSLVSRPKGSVQKELVTMLFESMLENIVESWESIVAHKAEDSTPFIMKTASEVTFTNKKKKPAGKASKTKRSRSKLDLCDNSQIDPLLQTWWSSQNEKAIIRFRNGNVYEGNISMKCMHGEGRFQWADGTVYLGEFKDNEIRGKGTIRWKDDTWYEGDFVGNLRHGKGLYVDSRRQRSYTGGWYCGTKHGQGSIFYSETFKNSYEGDWIHNVRHGYGSREYCPLSGYNGEWDRYVREGKGLMIWPNHDFYRGDWQNGVMSGFGIYVWDAYFNNSMSLPSINAYRGQWVRGLREGQGILNLGLGLGSHYKGEFKKNKKHGAGKFVTNNGLILCHKFLFVDDNLGAMAPHESEGKGSSDECKLLEPMQFDICDSSVGLVYHIEQALENIDKQADFRSDIINDFFEFNNPEKPVKSFLGRRVPDNTVDYDDLIRFEETSLRKALQCYETDLKNIYYKYATICNTEEIYFTPVLIRLYLWQLYYDCNVHEKGLTLVEIDRIYFKNKEWLSNSKHNPFEKIYFWQFLHSLISVASTLYAKKQLPGPKPDTILASAFRKFMDEDVKPGFGRCNGRLTHDYGTYVPLKALYSLYCSLGEPHTVRKFLCAVRRPPQYKQKAQPDLIETHDSCVPLGRNVYVYGDEITYITENVSTQDQEGMGHEDLPLFNFGNLSSKTIINIFAQIFPQLCEKEQIMNLDLEITFYEFFEAFIFCAEESMRYKEEELRWREKFAAAGHGHVHDPLHARTSRAAALSKTNK